MPERIRFAHGKKVNGFYCVFCDMQRPARIVRDRWQWRLEFKCGHVRADAGMVQPLEELQRKGYVNTPNNNPDPRYTAEVKRKWLDFIERAKAKKDFADMTDLFPTKSLT